MLWTSYPPTAGLWEVKTASVSEIVQIVFFFLQIPGGEGTAVRAQKEIIWRKWFVTHQAADQKTLIGHITAVCPAPL